MEELKKYDLSLIKQIGHGGFGKVIQVSRGKNEYALKLIPKLDGAEREFSFSNVDEAVNIIPILEVIEISDAWGILMPLAECSLRDRLRSVGKFNWSNAQKILLDVCRALVSLKGVIVHRDIKPENILLYNGRWCLVDFGISRYVEASTDQNTKRFMFTPPYAAPESWRFERPTIATDVYSVGIVAYELITGTLPFKGPTREDFREQHLHDIPPPVDQNNRVAAIIEDCLIKAPQARPSPSSLLKRLDSVEISSQSAGRNRLAEANLALIRETAATAQKDASIQTEREHRQQLFLTAKHEYEFFSEQFLTNIREVATAAKISQIGDSGWTVQMGSAALTLAVESSACEKHPELPFDIISCGTILLTIPPIRSGWEGRCHTLWFCNAVSEDYYSWYETAFMVSPLLSRRNNLCPFSLSIKLAASALLPGVADFQVAWPFTVVNKDSADTIIDRWVSWLADAATNRLSMPHRMPELHVEGSWRRK